MALYEIGLDFAAAKEEAEKELQPAPDGTYNLQVIEVEDGVTKNDRPRITVTFAIYGNSNPSLNGKKIRHFVTIPTPGNKSGGGFLVQLLTALKKPWPGGNFDSGVLVGATCVATLKKSDDGKFNNIDSFMI